MVSKAKANPNRYGEREDEAKKALRACRSVNSSRENVIVYRFRKLSPKRFAGQQRMR